MHGSTWRRLSLVAAGLTVIAGVAACAPPDADLAETPEAAQPATPPEVVVTGEDYSYKAPAEVPAGMTKLTLKNAGKEPHQIALFQLTGGKAFQDFADATADSTEATPWPEWVVAAGGPNAAAPGMASSSFVDLQPGYYVMLCNIPDAKGTPHVKLGMVRPLRVGPAAETVAEAPPADTTVKAEDFAFGVESRMTAGDHVIAFQNDGAQAHELTLFKLNEGAKAADVAAAFAPGASGPPPAMPAGGVVAVAPKASQSFPTKLEPGRYALICFLPDAKSGKAHAELGMMAEFEVR